MLPIGTVLGVWAHPDDEAYLMSGITRSLTAEGGRVVLVHATKGEAGSQDEERWPPAQMGQVREGELRKTLEVLGVHEHHFLGYIDGRCTGVSFEEAVGKVARIIHDVEPASVLTFPPDGGTGHPDHIAISDWTTAAFDRAARAGAALYYSTSTPEWLERFGPALEPYNVFAPGTPSVTPLDELGIYLKLTDDLLDTKMDALRAQESQTLGLFTALGEDNVREFIREEMFALAKVK